MAERPVFIPLFKGDQLVEEKMIPFNWNPGMAPTQKKKNVEALHLSAIATGIEPILEISTKSQKRIGFLLSAFNLKLITSSGWSMPLESAYQGSKVFEHGGPYEDLYCKDGSIIKKDERLTCSGRLCAFKYEGEEWDLEPKTAFYDWLYMKALHRNNPLISKLKEYKAFTDIEFNPKKSINCQARSCALYLSLLHRYNLGDILNNKSWYLDIIKKDSFYQPRFGGDPQMELL